MWLVLQLLSVKLFVIGLTSKSAYFQSCWVLTSTQCLEGYYTAEVSIEQKKDLLIGTLLLGSRALHFAFIAVLFLTYALYKFIIHHFTLFSLMTMYEAQFEFMVAVILSRVMRKPDSCLCEIKGADQLRNNCEADQRLCFRSTDNTTLPLPKSEISSF